MDVRIITKTEKKDQTDPGSYRPICLLAVLRKVLDAIIIGRPKHNVNSIGGRTRSKTIWFHKSRINGGCGQRSNVPNQKIQGRRTLLYITCYWCGGGFRQRVVAINNKATGGKRMSRRNLLRLTKDYFRDRTTAMRYSGGSFEKSNQSMPTRIQIRTRVMDPLRRHIQRTITGRVRDNCVRRWHHADSQGRNVQRLKQETQDALSALWVWVERTRLRFNPRKSEALFFGIKHRQQTQQRLY